MRGDVERALEILHQQSPDSMERALALLQDTVFAFSMKACGNPHDAEDTMQDVLIKAVRSLPGFEDPSALKVWLYKVARNSCLAHRRRPQSAPFVDLSLDALMPSEQDMMSLLCAKLPNPEEHTARGETHALLEQAIQELPHGYRAVLVLHDMEGLDHSEVAQVTGLREATVRVRLHRARLYVRSRLAPHLFGTLPGDAAAAAPPGAHRKLKNCRNLFARLSDYIDGVLEDDFCHKLQKHLHECPPCIAFLASLEQVVKLCRVYKPNRGSTTASRLREELLQEYKAAAETLAGRNVVGAQRRRGTPIARVPDRLQSQNCRYAQES